MIRYDVKEEFSLREANHVLALDLPSERVFDDSKSLSGSVLATISHFVPFFIEVLCSRYLERCFRRMDLTAEDQNLELENAFKRQIHYLEQEQEYRASNLPRAGKGVETTVDISHELSFRNRIAFLEMCLQRITQIASEVSKRVPTPIGDNEEPPNNRLRKTEEQSYIQEYDLQIDDEPYVNPFTGLQVVPKTLNAPGPSRGQNEVFRGLGEGAASSNVESKKPWPGSLGSGGRSSTNSFTERAPESATGDTLIDDDLSFALDLQARLDAENNELEQQAELAQKLALTEEQRFANLEEDLAAARHMQDQWERDDEIERQNVMRLQEIWEAENIQLLEQQRFAQELAQAEEERMAHIRRDNAAANIAQREWNDNIRAEEERTQAEFRVRMEEERRRQNEIQATKAQIAAKNEQEKRERLQEAERQRTERQEMERRAHQVECLACMDRFDRSNMCTLPCQHAYCGSCIKGAFQAAYKSRNPFQCCSNLVPVTSASRFLSTSFRAQYDDLVLESTTRNPKYCSNPSCSIFLTPRHIRGPVGICPKCRQRTCIQCGNEVHAGVCEEDKDGIKMLKLANKKGWKACPGCSQVVEKIEGCLHMTCKCRHEWCWTCLRSWGSCGSTCNRF